MTQRKTMTLYMMDPSTRQGGCPTRDNTEMFFKS